MDVVQIFIILTGIVMVTFLLTRQASIIVWTISYTIIALLLVQYGQMNLISKSVLYMIWATLIICATPLRRKLISHYLFHRAKKFMPSMSNTEREALEAGTIGWEGDLFRGAPDLNKLLYMPSVSLTAEEQAFIDGSVNELCRMIDDWQITHIDTDLSKEIWQFIKEKGFLGMIIPKNYGGLGFSATAQFSILAKLYGRSITVGTTVCVPNSLGPAELLLKYGTNDQKDYYLPRLADGREIPCFALTSPDAGSDAASIPDQGIVCYQHFMGKETLGISVTWNKRYVTLCPIATVIGLAFRLFDPENILGKGYDVGITCALIPANTPGVIKGRRHFPLNTAFLNGPTQGKDVFIPIEYLIGGAELAGTGWRMLMQCLSAGRAISLPSSAAGGAQVAALACGAYTRIRKQFNQPIGYFEGIQEPLARITGNTYMIDAALTMIAATIDHGAKPAVAGAILKYHSTERARQVAIDAMDIHGGKGICLGPNNYLGRGYQNTPISITVEGANILTRNLIIFGQGVMRCHPYAFRELESLKQNDVTTFDKALWSHIGFLLANFTKSFIFSITDAHFTFTPNVKLKRYYELIYRYSANLAFLADISLIMLGAALKKKEKISARLGDILSNLYLISAVLKRFYNDNEPAADLPLVEWCCQELFFGCAEAIHEVIVNFPVRWVRILLKITMQPFGQRHAKPSDLLEQRVAKILLSPNTTRERVTRLVFTEAIQNCPVGRLEAVFMKVCAVEDLEKKLLRAVKAKKLTALTFSQQIDEAEICGMLNTEQANLLREIEQARQAIIAVDDFDDHELRRQTGDIKNVKMGTVDDKLNNNKLQEALECN